MKRLAGIYLVIDPKQPWDNLLSKLQAALEGGVNIVQVWNHWPEEITEDQKLDFIKSVKSLTNGFDVPVLMHDDWLLAEKSNMDGVHFDNQKEQLSMINLPYIGVTVGNDLELIKWAAANDVSYISFCAIFPSPSVESCDIVDHEKINEARKLIDCPIFLSGGLTHNNLNELGDLPFDGIAVISGIMSAEDPKEAVTGYVNQLKAIKANKTH